MKETPSPEELEAKALAMPTERLKLSIESAKKRRASNEFDDTAVSTMQAYILGLHQDAYEKEVERREAEAKKLTERTK